MNFWLEKLRRGIAKLQGRGEQPYCAFCGSTDPAHDASRCMALPNDMERQERAARLQ